jgi:hypothetical protein
VRVSSHVPPRISWEFRKNAANSADEASPQTPHVASSRCPRAKLHVTLSKRPIRERLRTPREPGDHLPSSSEFGLRGGCRFCRTFPCSAELSALSSLSSGAFEELIIPRPRVRFSPPAPFARSAIKYFGSAATCCAQNAGRRSRAGSTRGAEVAALPGIRIRARNGRILPPLRS